MVAPDAGTSAMDTSSDRKVATFAGALGGTFGVLSTASCILSLLMFLRKRRERRASEAPQCNAHAHREDEEDYDIDGMSARPVPTAEVTLHTFHPFNTRLLSEPSSSQPPPYTPNIPLGHDSTGIQGQAIGSPESLPTFAEAIASPIPPLLANLGRPAAHA
ncbi:hypothetical protein NEOLEDRAFT_1178779 [Neolentinus lepideus HHB14362 ss-1]|uniref:Uncharacterized protein n=1 Tax=Neolentinus lepideus HHB14362 ss-1 TaxID=1314782 RepID=A0A165SE57_9AGAM|nr:hypothetical protein NEOLEDRAFT_1178779 [Neolentinus lepideus HHB14362 ss-1]